MLRKVPFNIKLMLAGLVPLAFLVYFGIQILNERNQRIATVTNLAKGITHSNEVMLLAEKLHFERRMSTIYLLGKTKHADVITARAATDRQMETLQSFLDTNWGNYRRYALLDKLVDHRKEVDEGQVSFAEVLNFYTAVLSRVFSVEQVSVRGIPYLKNVQNQLESQQVFFQYLNYFGLVRSQLLAVALTRDTSSKVYNEIYYNYRVLDSYLKEFQVKGEPLALERFEKLTSGATGKMVEKVLSNYFKKKTLPAGFDSDYWWVSSSTMVDDMRKMQLESIKKTQRDVETILEDETNELNRLVFLLIAIMLLVVLIVFFNIKSITDMLNELRVAAERISLGESNVKLGYYPHDAFGSLASSVKILDQNSSAIASAANNIGAGNFDVVITPRSKNDLLGNAILRMRDDLEKFSTEQHEKLWVQSGIAEIGENLRGEKMPDQLAKDTLTSLVSYTGAQIGLFYLANHEHQLRLIATQAILSEQVNIQAMQFGESLVGQVAVEKKPLYLREPHPDVPRVTSGVMDHAAPYVAILPLVFNDEVEGVIEIASLNAFTAGTTAFLREASSAIAVAVRTSKNRLRLQELLEETQAQSEELQAQHAELENINAELEAQAERLQTSEEELKVQQEELLQTNQELEERSAMLQERNEQIAERNNEIQRKAEELSLSTRYKSEFLANMSHELRTPLNSILLLSRLLSENHGSNLSQEQIEYAQVIQSSGKGLLTLIDEILDLSKIEAGKMDLEIGVVNIETLVAEQKQMFEPMAREKHIELIAKVDPNVPASIETDKLRLEQILRNLLSNAVKFTGKGSVTLSVGILSGNSNLVCFTVADTGIGIPADKQKLVFEAFHQADGSTRRKFGGTGLGLSISRELARLLGGEIYLESEEGKGSSFTLCVPRKIVEGTPYQAVRLEEKQPVSTNKPKVSKQETEDRNPLISEAIPASIPDDRGTLQPDDKVILIVEDDTAFAKSLLAYVRGQGYKGVIAVRGDEGIELAKQLKPLGILLDLQLPVKSGWDIMDALKSDPVTRHIPVHMMSSYDVEKESLQRGAIDFINKPVALDKMQEVLKKLEHVLTRHPKKVLILEENPKHAKALAYFLESMNVNSQISDSVASSITALKNQEVDCVILDMKTPAGASHQTLEEVRKHKDLEKVPVIIFTGKSLSQAEEAKIKQYANSIVVKTAHSYRRIFDEVSIFLHLVEENGKSSTSLRTNKNLAALTNVLQKKKVLVVDDDVRNIFSLSKALESHGMIVTHGMNGREAVKMLHETPDIDVILMDMMMPEMDGYESIRAIRSDIKYRNLPIIAVTAKAMAGDRDKCIEAGASDYISKPVDIDQLLSLLRVWLYD